MSYLRISIFIAFFSLVALAQAQLPAQKSSKIEIANGMPYYIHTVDKGQTLYAISKLYDVEVADITSNNDLKDGQLKDGTTIRIPQLITAQKQYTKKIIDGREFFIHTVAKGETLFSIGRAYDIKPSVIIAENPSASTSIAAGQILKIPATMSIPANTASAKAETSTKSAQQNSKQAAKHIVVQGESLYGIAKQYNTTVAEILALNPDCSNGLRTGSEITVPVSTDMSCFYHQVEKGETFYSISKLYGVNTDQLQKDNAVMLTGIKPGMYLRIQRTAENVRLSKTYSGFTFHEVEKGDTYYSICKKYGIDAKKFKKLNPATDEDALSIGLHVMVPVQSYQWAENDSIVVKQAPKMVRNGVPFFSCDSLAPNKDRVLNIALMLPLYLTENDTAGRTPETGTDAQKKQAAANANLHILPKTLPFLEFYEGALLALDTLKQQGYSINLSVYDTQRDTNATTAILKKLDKTTDLIIGPVYGNTFKIANAFAREHSIPIVSPLSSSLDDIGINPQAMIINTPLQYRVEATALFFAQNPKYNFIMVHDGGVKDFEIMDMYKKVLMPSFSSNAVFSDVVFKEINFSEHGISGVQDALSSSDRNIIIVPSQNQGFVNNIVTQLYQFQKRYEVYLAGLSQWEQYDNIELDYLFGLNFHFGTGNYIDYNSVAVRDFIKSYRTNYKTEPTKYSFQAFDILNYYARLLTRYPFFCCECIDQYSYQGLQTNFNMYRQPGGKGITNTDVRIVRYTPEFLTEVAEFDDQAARKKFDEKQKNSSSANPQFEQLFKK